MTPIWSKAMEIFHVKEKRRRRSWTTTIVAVIAIFSSLGRPENTLSFINSGNDKGYVACVSGDRDINRKSEFFAKTVLPVSYDSRGVQVFTGDYNDKTKKWTNIRRYEVKLGETCPGWAEGK